MRRDSTSAEQLDFAAFNISRNHSVQPRSNTGRVSSDAKISPEISGRIERMEGAHFVYPFLLSFFSTQTFLTPEWQREFPHLGRSSGESGPAVKLFGFNFVAAGGKLRWPR